MKYTFTYKTFRHVERFLTPCELAIIVNKEKDSLLEITKGKNNEIIFQKS